MHDERDGQFPLGIVILAEVSRELTIKSTGAKMPGVEHFIIDGQHRVKAQFDEDPDALIDTMVFTGLSSAERADLFILYNPKTISLYDIFKAQLYAKREDALSIARQVQQAGFELAYTPRCGDGQLSCIRALQFIDDGKQRVFDTLTVLKAAWGLTASAVEHQNIKGIGMFLTWHPTFDRDTLVTYLKNKGPYADEWVLAEDGRPLSSSVRPSRMAAVLHYALTDATQLAA